MTLPLFLSSPSPSNDIRCFPAIGCDEQHIVLTRVNPRAAAFGITPGMSAREFVAIIRRASAEPGRN